MKAFPKEFCEILNVKGKDLVYNPQETFAKFNESSSSAPIIQFKEILKAKKISKTIDLLDKEYLENWDKEQRNGVETSLPLSKNLAKYSKEKSAPYTQKMKRGLDLHPWDNEYAYYIGEKIGLIQFLRSPSLRIFISNISGLKLRYGYGRPYCQINCYESGDYVGLHTDWHDVEEGKNNFLLFQLNLSNQAVESQSLIYQEKQHLTGVMHHRESSVSICKLPFWHMLTPLEARRGMEVSARRWMVSAAFQIQ